MTAHNATNYKILNEYNNAQSIVTIDKRTLEQIGIAVVDQNILVMPVGINQERAKEPFYPLIPIDPTTGKKSVKLYWQQTARSGQYADDIRLYVKSGTLGLAMATESVTVLDGDHAATFETFLAIPQVKAIFEHYRIPLMRSGGGGYQAAFIVDVPPNQKPLTSILAYIPNETKESGREVAIEAKGRFKNGHFSFVSLPGSLHPSGNFYYELDHFGGSYTNIPTITLDDWNVLYEAAKSLCRAQKSRQQLQAEKLERKRSFERLRNPRPTYENERTSPIDRYNEQASIRTVLAEVGYTELENGRFSSKKSNDATGDVTVDESKNVSHHFGSNDANYGTKKPFDLYCWHYYGGDIRKAVKELAKELGMDYASQYAKERADRAQKAASVAGPTIVAASIAVPAPVTVPVFVPAPVDYFPPLEPPMIFDDYRFESGYDNMSYDDILLDCGVTDFVQLEPPATESIFYPKGEELAPVAEEFSIPKKQAQSAFDPLFDEHIIIADWLLDPPAIQSVTNALKYRDLVGLKAPTGVGKSYGFFFLFGDYQTRVLVLPYVTLAQQVASDYDAVGVWGDEPIERSANGRYAITYDRLHHFAQFCEAEGIELNDSMLLGIDECHHLTTSGGLRGRAMRRVMREIKKYKKVILLSATPIAETRLMESAYKIEVMRHGRFRGDTQFYTTESTDILAQAKWLLAQGCDRIAILMMHKPMQSVFKPIFEAAGLPTVIFNADDKESAHFTQLIDLGIIDAKSKIILTTNVINDGVSINPDGMTWGFISAAISNRNTSGDAYVQFLSRFREKANFSYAKIAIFAGKNERSSQILPLSYFLNIHRETAKRHAETVNHEIMLRNIKDPDHLDQRLDILRNSVLYENGLIEDENGFAVGDDIWIENKSWNEYTNQFTALDKIDLTIHKMGGTYCGVFHAGMMDDETKQAIKEAKSDSKADKKIVREAFIEELRGSQEFCNENALELLKETKKDNDLDRLGAAGKAKRTLAKGIYDIATNSTLQFTVGTVLEVVQEQKRYGATALKALGHQMRLNYQADMMRDGTISHDDFKYSPTKQAFEYLINEFDSRDVWAASDFQNVAEAVNELFKAEYLTPILPIKKRARKDGEIGGDDVREMFHLFYSSKNGKKTIEGKQVSAKHKTGRAINTQLSISQ